MKQKIKVKLKALSPIHIGSGDRLNPFEFLSAKGKFVVVDGERFFKALEELRETDAFIKWLEKTSGKVTLENFVAEQPQNIRQSLYESLGRNWIAYTLDVYSSSDSQKPQSEVIGHIKTINYQPYIPGSSIKGALRNAILYCVVKDGGKERDLIGFAQKSLKELEDRRRKGQRVGRRDASGLANRFVNDLLMGYAFSPQASLRNEDAHTDIFSCLKISDTKLLPPASMAVYQLDVLGLSRKLPIWAEAIKPGQEMEFTIDIDTYKLDLAMKHTKKEQPIKDAIYKWLLDPLGAMERFASDCLAYEKQATKRIAPNVDLFANLEATPNFRIGFGGGMISNTISLLLDEATRRQIRDLFFKRSSSQTAPKTRKVVSNVNLELGWALANEVK